MNKFAEFISQNVLNILVWFLVIINILPILAPVFRAIGLDAVADLIYFVYSFSCHQFHWRSLHLFEHQIAWCTRDTFIWLSLLAVALATKSGLIKKGLPFYWIIPFMIPIAMDGGIQTIATVLGFSDNSPFYLSTNFMRMITGSIFGIGLGVVITPFMKAEQDLARIQSNKI